MYNKKGKREDMCSKEKVGFSRDRMPKVYISGGDKDHQPPLIMK